MERASGWYKRKAQLVLALLATIFAIGLNVDAVQVAHQLYNDEAVRTAVVGQVRLDRAAGGRRRGGAGQPASAPGRLERGEPPSDVVGWLSPIPGWLITIAALNLGAPFWFDLLSRLSRQRGAGIPEQPARRLSDKRSPDAMTVRDAAGLTCGQQATDAAAATDAG